MSTIPTGHAPQPEVPDPLEAEPVVLELEDLVMHYGPVRAVDGVTLQIRRGQVTALVGESGSGKSTVGRCIVRLVEPTGGAVRLAGADVTHLSRSQMRAHRRDVSIVFQDPAGSLDPRMLVGDVIAEPLRLQSSRLSRQERAERVADGLRRVGLRPEVARRYPHELSGGQRQRVSIARALMSEPTLLVADEPTSALDVSVQASVLNLLADLQRDIGFACLFITHDLSAVEYLADDIAVMYLGQLVEQGTREEIFAQPTAPLHAGPARCRARGRPREAARPHPGPARRRPPVGDGPALGLPLPHALPGRSTALRRGGAEAPAGGGQHGGLPPRRGRWHRAGHPHHARIAHDDRTLRMTFTTRPTLEGTFGMVSSTHWIASQAAMRELELGGNAFDAAVAAGFVLHVVEPHLNGPGGDMPAIIATAQDPTPRVLCGQGPAPAGATIEHYRDEGLDLVPGSGPLAAALPGAVDAWLLLLRDHGTRSLADVLEPAIGYARHGHPLLGRVSSTVETVRELFESDWHTSADLWLEDGKAPAPGALFKNPTYADTLDRLVAEGRAAGSSREAQIDGARRAWSQGFVAEAVDAFSRKAFRDSSGESHGGLITGADMAAYSATWESATTIDFHGHTIAKTGAWGQGPALLQTLRTLDALDDPALLDPSTTAGIHAAAESLKLAFADREAWYGDGDVPLETLLSTEYAAQRASLVGATAAPGPAPREPGRTRTGHRGIRPRHGGTAGVR